MFVSVNTDPNRFASPLPDVVPNTHPDEPSFPITQAPPRAETPPPVPSPARPPLRKRRLVTQQEASDNESNDVPMSESQNPNSQRAGSEAPAVPSQAVTRRKIPRRQPSQPVEPPPEPEPEPGLNQPNQFTWSSSGSVHGSNFEASMQL